MRKDRFQHVALVAGFLGFVFLQSCKKETEVNPGFGPNGEPRVLAVQIPNIPDQNIQIDQNLKQIVVTLPTSFSARFVYPALSLTPGTSTNQSQPYFFDLFGNDNAHKLPIKTSDNKTNAYTFVVKPAGDLAFGAVSAPLSYSLTDQLKYVCLPVYNFFDEQPLSTVTLALTHKVSGERIVLPNAVLGRESLCDQKARTDGAIMISVGLSGFDMYYKPGDYIFTLTKSNGRTATLAQPIQLASASTATNFNVNYTLKLNSGDYLLYGANFYRGDKISVRFQGKNQPDVTLDALGFIDRQPGVRLPTAVNLKPGYYYTQLLVNGVPTASTGRLSVSDQDKPLLLESLSLSGQSTYKNLLGESYSFDTPIILNKEAGYAISTNYYQFTQNDNKPIKQVRLTSLTDPSKAYTVPFGKDQYGSSDQITLPGTLPAGRYQLTLQIIRSDGTEINGMPLERDVVVQ